ncbi:MAG: glycine--tRNA ligase subunit beta, partial [Alphaproteobacteria bacterium]|nr:glycine--tRNA ligase subunit beta [Alphaproteobacteria bacterium]
LGSVHDKVRRVEKLAGAVAEYCGADAIEAKRAARLAKADLSTGMVAEFPELQGVMGRYYALADGEEPEVADAIAEHYSPQGPNDSCPTAPIAMAVALADKIDTLVGFFAIDEKPTGSRDPFALRRAALGVIRIITENGLRVPLREVIKSSYLLQPSEVLKDWEARMQAADIAAKELGLIENEAKLDTGFEFGHILLPFFADRLKVQMRAQGVRHDLIEAVFATPKPEGGAEDDLVRLLARVDALAKFLKSDDGGNLLVAYKRAANIVRIEEKNDANTYNGEYKLDLLSAPEEKALASHLDAAAAAASTSLSKEDFTAAMSAIARLRGPIDDFFDHVTVNTDEPELRENRLNLLSQIGRTLDQVADFSKIEGGDR